MSQHVHSRCQPERKKDKTLTQRCGYTETQRNKYTYSVYSTEVDPLIGNALVFWLYHHRNTRSLHHDSKTNKLKRRQAKKRRLNKIKHSKITFKFYQEKMRSPHFLLVLFATFTDEKLTYKIAQIKRPIFN